MSHRLVLTVALALTLAVAPAARASVDACQKSVEKTGAKLEKLLAKTFQKCVDGYRKTVVKEGAIADAAASCQIQLDKSLTGGSSAVAQALAALHLLPGAMCSDSDLLALGHLPQMQFGDRWLRWVVVARIGQAYEEIAATAQDAGSIFAAMAAAGGCPSCAKIATPPCFRQTCSLGATSGAKAYAPALFSIALTGDTLFDVCRYDDVLPNEYALVGNSARTIAKTLLLGNSICTRVVGTEGFVACTGSTAPKVSYTSCQDHVVSAPDIDECTTATSLCTSGAADPIPEHTGAQNGGICVDFTTAPAAVGAAFALARVEISIVTAAQVGPDGIACSADDTAVPLAVTVPLTTATAQGFLYDAADISGNNIAPPAVVGAPFNCANIPTGSLSAAQLVGSAPAMHALCLSAPCDDPNTPADEGNVPIDAVAEFTLACQ